MTAAETRCSNPIGRRLEVRIGVVADPGGTLDVVVKDAVSLSLGVVE